MLRLLAGLLLIPLATGGCGNGDTPGASTPPARVASAQPASPYRFDASDARFELPGRLDEISGLTVLDDGLLGAVQDEKGHLYVLDAATGEVVAEHDFGKNGDYEGVERVGDRVVVLRSDGHLFVIDDWHQEKSDATEIKTGLHGSCDAEGLGYDAENDRLLIACKEGPGRGYRGSRAVYAFSLATNALDPTPAFTIHADSVAHSGDRTINATVRALVRPITDINTFKPSALAVHPRTGEVWVLSSVRKLLLTLDRAGRVTAVWPLPDRLLRQPEALAFLPDGTLLIASEAAGGKAILLRFDYRPNGL